MKKNQKGFGALSVLLILIVIGLIAGGGWLVYHSHKSPNKSDSTQLNTRRDTTKTTTTDPYAGWSKVTLARSGLTARYPSGWSVKSSNNDSSSNSTNSIDIKSPTVSGHYFDIGLQEGPANTNINLNMLGRGSGTTLLKLSVAGSTGPLYLDSQTGDSLGMVGCIGLATTPGSQNHDTAFGILDNNGKGNNNIVAYACLMPVAPTLSDNGIEYSASAYTSSPDYNTVVKIFQSLSYAK